METIMKLPKGTMIDIDGVKFVLRVDMAMSEYVENETEEELKIRNIYEDEENEYCDECDECDECNECDECDEEDDEEEYDEELIIRNIYEDNKLHNRKNFGLKNNPNINYKFNYILKSYKEIMDILNSLPSDGSSEKSNLIKAAIIGNKIAETLTTKAIIDKK